MRIGAFDRRSKVLMIEVFHVSTSSRHHDSRFMTLRNIVTYDADFALLTVPNTRTSDDHRRRYGAVGTGRIVMSNDRSNATRVICPQ
jgi:hypothetical protein